MRTIKFRGRCNVTGKWVYGDLLHARKGVFIRVDSGAYVQIDPATVGQFTGMTDAEGIEVYEGDVVTVLSSDTKHEIVYAEGDAAFIAIPSMDAILVFSAGFKVIGNIHEPKTA